MFLAAVHFSPAWSIPLAVALAGVLVWYWFRLRGEHVPTSRRKIRRVSIALMLLSLPMLVRAVSFLDPEVDKRPYVVNWTIAIFMLLLVIATALMDAINNLRLHQEMRQDALHEAAIDLAQAVREHRARSSASGAPSAEIAARLSLNGHGGHQAGDGTEASE